MGRSASRRRIGVILAGFVLSGAIFTGVSAARPAAVIEVFPGPNALANAVAAAQPGDVLDIHAGTYPEHVIISTSRLTLKAAGDGPVTLDGGCAGIWTIQIIATGTRLQQLAVIGGTFGEITFTHVPSGTVSGVAATDTCPGAEYGINVFSSGSIVITGNRTSGFGDAGIYIGAIRSTPMGPMVVRGNESFGNEKGVIVEDSAGGTIKVSGNSLHDNATIGLWLHNSDGVAITDNTLTDDGDSGIDVDPTSDGNLIARNTASGHTFDLENEGGLGNCFRNNVYTTSFGDISC